MTDHLDRSVLTSHVPKRPDFERFFLVVCSLLLSQCSCSLLDRFDPPEKKSALPPPAQAQRHPAACRIVTTINGKRSEKNRRFTLLEDGNLVIREDALLLRFDPEGHLLLSLDHKGAMNANRTELSWDQQGRITSCRNFSDTGAIEFDWRYEYEGEATLDNKRKPVLRAADAPCLKAAAPKGVLRTRFDEQGRKALEMIDYNADGGVDETRNYRYEHPKLIIVEERDAQGNVTTVHRHTLDEAGQLIADEEDADVDDRIEMRREQSWTSSDQLNGIRVFQGTMDNPQEQISCRYDKAGRLTAVTREQPLTESKRATHEFNWDPAGNLISAAHDHDGTGDFEITERYYYDCWPELYQKHPGLRHRTPLDPTPECETIE